MNRGNVGSRTGGKGSWRRKAKKAPHGGNQEGQKLWAAAQSHQCRDFGELDSAAIIVKDSEEAFAFTKPELIANTVANTYLLKGEPQKKPIVEVLTEFLSSMDLSKLGKGVPAAETVPDDLGEIPEGVDFGNPEAEVPSEEPTVE
jgi:nascent polypeptide-associated complex subunit beta